MDALQVEREKQEERWMEFLRKFVDAINKKRAFKDGILKRIDESF